MAEDGVQDSVTYYDSDAIEIVVTVQMATPPSGEKLSSLEKAAERGAAEGHQAGYYGQPLPYRCQSSSMTSVEPTATVRPTDAAWHTPFDYLRANRITKVVRLLIGLRSSYPRIGVAKFPQYPRVLWRLMETSVACHAGIICPWDHQQTCSQAGLMPGMTSESSKG